MKWPVFSELKYGEYIMTYLDTHCHIDLFEKPEQIVSLAETNQVYTIAVTNAPSVFFYTKKICEGKIYVKPALGLHPELAAQKAQELSMFCELIDDTKYIGEVGLDGQSKGTDDFEIQKKVFEKILSVCAERKNKILTVHSRNAATEVISMIGNNYPGKIILHWFSGSFKELELAVSYGFYFSINYPMTISEKGRKIIEKLPLERILIETDGPFTKFNSQPSTPLLSIEISNKIIAIKNSHSKSIIGNDIFLNNFKNLYSNEKKQF